MPGLKIGLGFNNFQSSLRFDEEGVAQLAETLRVTPAITRLDLRDNYIGQHAAHLAESLRGNSTLVFLNLGNCDIG